MRSGDTCTPRGNGQIAGDGFTQFGQPRWIGIEQHGQTRAAQLLSMQLAPQIDGEGVDVTTVGKERPQPGRQRAPGENRHDLVQALQPRGLRSGAFLLLRRHHFAPNVTRIERGIRQYLTDTRTTAGTCLQITLGKQLLVGRLHRATGQAVVLGHGAGAGQFTACWQTAAEYRPA